jgi:hypothetical protein
MSTIIRGDDYFATVTYTGTGSAQTISGLRFQPDLVWIKIRSQAFDHTWVDAVRGTGKDLESSSNAAEDIRSTVTAFGSDGFTVGTDSQVNSSGNTFVGWCWNAGGSTVTNTSGTISSQVRANPTAGFSIVTYTGNGSAGATIGHGLGVAPTFIIVKNRARSSNWIVYISTEGPNRYGYLNLTNPWVTDTTGFNNVSPTSTVFSVGTAVESNASGEGLVAYCFAPVAGYSAFGSYTGNGSTDGPFQYLGFRPRWMMVKEASQSGANWRLWDTARSTYNIMGLTLYPSLSNAEGQENYLDYLSNGFKIRIGGPGNGLNDSSVIYNWAAFAENPFQYALAR